ncbi:hypothetical protein OOK60_14025 [Trichothermofontia sichuanensis B231]|nr:hypothetical protein [Trichothermofontia sichuanensis]UZQ53606.1 hypothetical protein OOK60_14025 [Trichothermofontia sichuanensis B231]
MTVSTYSTLQQTDNFRPAQALREVPWPGRSNDDDSDRGQAIV